jgi:GT2 family glycosyltransferase
MAESRNVGTRDTSSDLVLSVDSDMRLEDGLIAELVRAFDRAPIDAMTIQEAATGVGYWARARNIDKKSVEATGYGQSIRAFRRSLFDLVGGYDPSLEAGEDTDFHRRAMVAGARLAHIHAPRIFHEEGRLTLGSVIKKKRKYGRSLRAFELKHGMVLKKGYLLRVAVGIQIGIREDPLVAPGFAVLKAADALAGLLGRASSR